jgi:hypothetical protein
MAEWAKVPLAFIVAITATLAIVVQAGKLSKRLTSHLLVLVVLSSAGTVTTGTIFRSKRPPPTNLITTRVFAEDGNLVRGYRVVERVQADDCIRSLTGAGSDAVRCFSTSGIYDPCWVNPQDKAACPKAPWSADIVLVTKIRMLERDMGGVSNPNSFWGLELANGDRCTFATGTAEVIDHERVNYRCVNGGVVGDPDRTGPVWKVRYFTLRSRQITNVTVRRAWA